jgi:hypothetical protein
VVKSRYRTTECVHRPATAIVMNFERGIFVSRVGGGALTPVRGDCDVRDLNSCTPSHLTKYYRNIGCNTTLT